MNNNLKISATYMRVDTIIYMLLFLFFSVYCTVQPYPKCPYRTKKWNTDELETLLT